jgi:hypothetical protein
VVARIADGRQQSEVGGMNTSEHLNDSGTFGEIQFDRRSLAAEVAIQEIPSRLYLSESDFLTVDIENARKFDSSLAAPKEATFLKLHSVQLVMNGQSKEWEILPVGATVIL